MRFRNLVKLAAVCALMICALPLFSSSASGDFIFNDLTFSNFQETPTQPLVCKFGSPVAAGTMLQFPDYILNSSSVGGVGGGTASTSLSMTISSTTSYLKTLNFTEGGNYILAPYGTDAPKASASIASTGSHIDILDASDNVISTVYPQSGDFSNNYAITGAPTQSSDWIGPLVFDLTGKNATKVRLVLDNIVNTTSSGSALAYLGGAKAAVSMNVTTIPVPEPGSLALLGMGGLLFAFVRNRKRSFR